MVIPKIPSGSSSSTIKSRNLSVILLMLLRYESVSRVRLSRLTGLSTTTITNLISELIDEGIVEQVEPVNVPRGRRGVGRPQVALRLVPDARYAVGVHIGVGSIRVSITNLLAEPIAVRIIEHDVAHSVEVVLQEVVSVVQDLIRHNRIEARLIVGVGIGASGLVDPSLGVNVLAPNLGWRNVSMREFFASHLGLPVIIDNNVRAMALGEALFGVGKDVQSLAFVYSRIGVGAGIVVGGKLYYGGGAGAGEIGHTTIVPEGGDLCRCGNRGCLETVVSETAIVALAAKIADCEPDGLLAAEFEHGSGKLIERVFNAARAGDPATIAMLQERARYLGLALANLVNILNPDVIVLGGILAEGQDLLLPVVQDTVRQAAFANLGEKVDLALPSFNDNSGIVGAAALALNAFLYQHTEGAY